MLVFTLIIIQIVVDFFNLLYCSENFMHTIQWILFPFFTSPPKSCIPEEDNNQSLDLILSVLDESRLNDDMILGKQRVNCITSYDVYLYT